MVIKTKALDINLKAVLPITDRSPFCQFSKILEKLFHMRLVSFIEKYNLLQTSNMDSDKIDQHP